MKSAAEWFDECLEAPIASRAKSYLKNTTKDKFYESLYKALMYGFSWEDTLEGWHYWNKVTKGNA